MPEWTAHTEGGSWYGGGTEVPECSLTQRTRILQAYSNFVNDTCLNCFPGLKACLQAEWSDVEIDCTDPDCVDLGGRRSGNKILMCNTSPTRVGPVLLHELVQWCDGTELDSEAVEHAYFNGLGATLPTPCDWTRFRSETDELDYNEIERVDKCVIWNSNTGQVWGKQVKGDGWGGGDPVTGSLCFQSNDWQHSNADDGGW